MDNKTIELTVNHDLDKAMDGLIRNFKEYSSKKLMCNIFEYIVKIIDCGDKVSVSFEVMYSGSDKDKVDSIDFQNSDVSRWMFCDLAEGMGNYVRGILYYVGMLISLCNERDLEPNQICISYLSFKDIKKVQCILDSNN